MLGLSTPLTLATDVLKAPAWCTDSCVQITHVSLFPLALTWLWGWHVGDRFGLRIFARFGVFEWKDSSWRKVLPLAAAYALCTPLSNLSLAYNSVGFYQMLKILTTPYVALVEGMFYGATFSQPIKLSLLIVTIGVLLASVNDVEVSGNFIVLPVSVTVLGLYDVVRNVSDVGNCLCGNGDHSWFFFVVRSPFLRFS